MAFAENNRINKTFLELKSRGERALICYVVGGYPDFSHSEQIISALVSGGADIIEIGIPFSDPIADGPTIQDASFRALAKGMTPDKCLQLAKKVRKNFPDLPIVAMTYSNILFKRGFKEFMCASKIAGIDGFILPDMAIEESENYVEFAKGLDLATVFLVSPNTARDRIKKIISYSSGFLYVVSVFGTTGTRSSVFAKYSITAIRNIKNMAGPAKNVAVGFGISSPCHVKQILGAGADAVIVGSAIIEKIKQGTSSGNIESKLKLYATTMKRPCRQFQ
ncbi:MAG: tryptophan synthase subunit alpha [Thermoproteota archaeon]|nr:tryptophan synthase subunit alpha [Thermoproteota archaeon]